jgi:Lipoprotein LpqB beta-propeller domain/Sporulation and spore germination
VPRTASPRALVAAGLAALLVSACATVPDSGAVQSGKLATAAQQYLLQPVTVGPQRNWGPGEVVAGFLETLDSYAHGYAAARQYLDPSPGNDIRKMWDPHPGWAVRVTGPLAREQIRTLPQEKTGVSGASDATVVVTARQQASVTDEGQYQVSQDQPTLRWTFALKKINGQWLITSVPPVAPPLYAASFQRVYLPRDLYFLAPSDLVSIHETLVPDPIFVPLQATSVEVAETLVRSLLHNPQGWLTGAAITALDGTSLLGRVTINSGTATVDLRGQIASASPTVLDRILAQLVWTLASPSYGQAALAQSVELEINGQPQQLASWSGGQPQQGGRPLLTEPQAAPGQRLYALLAGRDVVGALPTSKLLAGKTVSPVRIPVQTGGNGSQLTSIAVSPDGRYVAGISQSGAVYYGQLRRGARLTEWTRHAPFVSLSWDSNDNLWAVGTGAVMLLHPGRAPVSLGGLPSGSVVQMRVAPDGVRAALIVNGSHGNQLFLYGLNFNAGPHGVIMSAALGASVVIGADVSGPTQAVWYDTNDLLVLSPSTTGTLLHEVPVNGGSSTALIPPPSGVQSISSLGPNNPLAAGLSRNGLALANGLLTSWTTRKNIGQSPTYAAPASG